MNVNQKEQVMLWEGISAPFQLQQHHEPISILPIPWPPTTAPSICDPMQPSPSVLILAAGTSHHTLQSLAS